MKTFSQLLKMSLVAALAFCGAGLPASAALAQLDGGAATTEPSSASTTVPSTTYGPSNTGTTGTAGYQFYDTASAEGPTLFNSTGTIGTLPSYVTSTTVEGGQATSGSDSQITLGSDQYFTGSDLGNIYSHQAVNSVDLLKITLGGTGNAFFDLGILSNNSSFDANTLYTLSLYNGATNAQIGTTLTVNSTASAYTAENNFYYAQVYDPNPGTNGDYLILAGGSSLFDPTAVPQAVYDVGLGGVTFDTLPEPSTYGLLGLGALAMLVVVRRRLV